MTDTQSESIAGGSDCCFTDLLCVDDEWVHCCYCSGANNKPQVNSSPAGVLLSGHCRTDLFIAGALAVRGKKSNPPGDKN